LVAVEQVGSVNLSIEQTKAQIMAYLREQFKKEKQIYPSDVADALGLDYSVVRKVFDELEQEGQIQESR
jgi:DNA-binding MarR family transcriptional regulator